MSRCLRSSSAGEPASRAVRSNRRSPTLFEYEFGGFRLQPEDGYSAKRLRLPPEGGSHESEQEATRVNKGVLDHGADRRRVSPCGWSRSVPAAVRSVHEIIRLRQRAQAVARSGHATTALTRPPY